VVDVAVANMVVADMVQTPLQFTHSLSASQTDRRTDGQTDVNAISSRASTT